MSDQYKIELSREQLQVVEEALVKLPFWKVHGLVETIAAQVRVQIAEREAAKEQGAGNGD